jgi:tungstate transport system ATP-binding protein
VKTILELKKITKEYDGKLALRGVNLSVNEGEIFSVIGPNGAGKTTLLRIMALLDEPTGGEIVYKGLRVGGNNSAHLREKVTMVFQQPVLFNSTVFDNIAYGLKVRGYPMEEIKQKVNGVLEFTRLRGLADRKAKRLSGGEQQRTIIARSLVLNPEVLLLDEPTANLDRANTILVEKIIRGLKGKTTVVVATHNLFQARRLSDRTACILDGELICVGKTADIFKRPKDERVRRFIKGEYF